MTFSCRFLFMTKMKRHSEDPNDSTPENGKRKQKTLLGDDGD